MDKLFHFSGNKNAARTNSSLQYYSDVEIEDTPKLKPELVVKMNKLSNSNFKLDEYVTADTLDNEQVKSTSKMTNTKVSKVFSLSTKQPEGDEGLYNQDEQTTQMVINTYDNIEKLRVKKSNLILENAKREVASNLEKHNPYAQKDLKLRLLADSRNIDSDIDVKKIEQKNQIIDNLKPHDFRHLIFSNYISESAFKKHLTVVYRGLVYANKCLKGPTDSYIKQKQVHIPRPKNSKGKTLFLDLDETLIHSCAIKDGPDHIIKSGVDKGEVQQIGLRVRPYCLEFLQKMTQYWDIYIFTASSPSYAEAIINFIDPQRKYISGILNRSNCMETKNGFFIKDLRIVSDSDMKYTILVDNLAHSFGFQPDNGIPILEWHSDKQDQELKFLMNYLIQAAQSSDVREFNKKNLRLDQLISLSPQQLGI